LTEPVNNTPESVGGDLSLIKSPKTLAKEVPDEEEQDRTQYPLIENETDLVVNLITQEHQDVWINTKTFNSIEFHLTHDKKKANLTLEQQVPMEYHNYLDVFEEKKAGRFPEPRTWDHKIELKDGL
jgi:hypothetical protein